MPAQNNLQNRLLVSPKSEPAYGKDSRLNKKINAADTDTKTILKTYNAQSTGLSHFKYHKPKTFIDNKAKYCLIHMGCFIFP